ncbi:uncharacterized protein SCHCODRAFT_02672338 [Schizophyllum commune H4-8]|uniref:uncharacterized protein n=1 Tax=Schizophyllum commune (strain H4-8 / FGSC 9210) TaxID=578458 RepID=UPI002160DCA9|nr:uncharacterized protein SCHCODRAFT_02672338 [Schizophyllum commune H4-8]KAI5887195.1 hypothetical protein SCHCODRAFT_02672338 [Schizophyllum commune H4-8]
MPAPQVDRFTTFKADFQALVTNDQPYDTLVIPPELLKHDLLKELFTRLGPSRIPKLPLDQHGARAIRDALDALTLYSHYAQAALWSGDVVKKAYITEQLPNVWKWALWLLPGAGNVVDVTEVNAETLSFPLRKNGKLVVPVDLRYTQLMILIGAILITEKDADTNALLRAQPRFMQVMLAVLAHNWDSSKCDTSNAAPLHAMMGHLRDSLSPQDDPEVVFRALADVTAFDKKNPGRLFAAITERLPWLYAQEEAYSAEFLMGYICTLSALHDYAPESFRDGIRRAKGGVIAVRLLSRVVPDENHPRQRIDETQSISILMLLLDEILMTRLSDDELVEVINAGLLGVIDRLNRYVPLDHEDREDQRAMVNKCMSIVIMPSLRAVEAKLLDEERPVHPKWPEWTALLKRCSKLWKRFTTFEERMAEVQSSCHNPECTQPNSKTKNGICECAKVAYCSPQCQKAHWRKAHRDECTRDSKYPMIPCKVMPDAPSKPKLTYVQRHFIRACALRDLANTRDADRMAGRAVMVDYTDPSEGDWAKGFTVANIQLPDGMTGFEAVAKGMTRVFVRVGWGTRLAADVAVEKAISAEEVESMREPITVYKFTIC